MSSQFFEWGAVKKLSYMSLDCHYMDCIHKRVVGYRIGLSILCCIVVLGNPAAYIDVWCIEHKRHKFSYPVTVCPNYSFVSTTTIEHAATYGLSTLHAYHTPSKLYHILTLSIL